MQTVTNQYGVDIETETMAQFAYGADEDLAIQITNMPCDNDQQWFDVFCWAYVLKHNEPFFLDDPNPVF